MDVWISRIWGVSPEAVRSWTASDVERCIALLGGEGMLARKTAGPGDEQRGASLTRMPAEYMRI